jgi:hypothetical protein
MVPLGGNLERHKEARKPAPRRVPRESPDPAPAAANSRFDLASQSASYDQATPTYPTRQSDRSVAFSKRKYLNRRGRVSPCQPPLSLRKSDRRK